ncbi:MAG: PQQ-like beta-propeller repeat protein [Blastocatellia bacterium]|nr:PQQ-like beta-propeller repeat protein [Blastocatellia bacterium]
MRFAGLVILSVVWTIVATAQGRGPTDWMTSNGDAQRSSWVRADAKISRERLQKPGFQFLWKLQLKNKPKQLNSLTPPALLDLLIGYRGFRTLAFVGGSSDNVFVIDTDLGRLEWEKNITSSGAQSGGTAGTMACPGGMTAGVTRPTITAIAPPPPPARRNESGGRGSLASSAVGNPGQGAVMLARMSPPPPPPPKPAAPPKPSSPPPPQAPGSNIFGAGPFLVYSLASDGMLHSMHLSNGADFAPPLKFLPPNANGYGLTVIDNVAYIVTEQNCGGVPNGLWALDLATREVKSWKANITGSAGPAFGPDGTVYVTTGGGEESPFSLVALDPKTLQVKGKYSAGNIDFTSSPVVFAYKDKILIAATTRDGVVHLLDSKGLQAPLYRTPAFSSSSSTATSATEFPPPALSSWQSTDGTRWLLAPVSGPVSTEAGFTAATGGATKGAIVAWKVVEKDGAIVLQPGWVSRELTSPLPPTIINGVVFALSSGEYRSADNKLTAPQRAKRSSPAILYALDGETGKELWNSGATITSFVHGGSLSGGSGQLYVGTYDGTLYAFGFPMEH